MVSDDAVLDLALGIIHGNGPEALTFASLSEASGLSPATLVQRFRGKGELKQAALLLAWDRLDANTARLAGELPRTPEGAIGLLVKLSGDYGEIEAYAEGLMVLREDFRDPILRARGAKWRDELFAAIDGSFHMRDGWPAGMGALVATQWQGCLLWWAFDPKEPVGRFVERQLSGFIDSLRGRTK